MRFLLTGELARLARWLRLMGYDAVSAPSTEPLPDLYCRAHDEGRVLLTRNRRIGPSCLFRVVQIASPALEAQLRQLVGELGVSPARQAFSRCDRCNVAVEPVEKAAVEGRVPAYVYQTQAAFTRCPSCERIYWAATHQRRIAAVLERVTRGAAQ